MAAIKGHYSTCTALLDLGADPRVKSQKDQTALTYAYNHDHQQLAYYLYCRISGSRWSTWSEFFKNPFLLMTAAILGVASFVHHRTIYEFTLDLMDLWR